MEHFHFLTIFVPQKAHAASVCSLVNRVESAIINPLIGILFALAFLVFVWGVVRFLYNAEDENEREQGKQHMLWGLIGMFIMVGVIGILNIVLGTFGISVDAC